MSSAINREKGRQRRLNIRLSQEEYDSIQKLSDRTTCRSISEYSRKVLLKEPVRVYYRNQSFDVFEQQMLRLLPQLQKFGENFDKLIMKDSGDLSTMMDHALNFMQATQDIRSHIEQLARQCDQK